MTIRSITVAATALSLLAGSAFAQGKMAPKPAAKMAPKATMSCKMCKMNVCDKCAKEMGGKDKMGHKMSKGATGECAMCAAKMKGGKMGKMMDHKMGGKM